MEVVAATLSWFLSNSTLSLLQLPTFLSPLSIVPNITDSLFTELSPLLSPHASIHLATSPSFAQLTTRWSSLHPDYLASVEVFSEADVVAAVQFANAHDIPFLAHSSGHGTWSSLNDVQGGLQVYMRGLNAVEVLDGGSTARIGGGVLTKEVVKALADEGKYAVTGLCACTSLVGPALGGGHGVLQGHYGYMADSIVSARLVLANGSVVVVSEDEHPDLFWGLRGAGHNFGIVMEMEYRVYDIPQESRWTITTFVLGESSLEELVERVSGFIDPDVNPPGVLFWITLVRVPELDEKNPIIQFMVLQEHHGSTSAPAQYTDPFVSLSPMTMDVQVVTEFEKLFAAMGFPETHFGCQKDYDLAIMTVSLPRLNASATRELFNAFAEVTGIEGLGGSAIMLEAYSTKGVRSVDERTTAVSREERQASVLVGGFVIHAKSDAILSGLASAAAMKMKSILKDGVDAKRDGEVGSYINYGNGEQTLGETYGLDEWRLKKLRQLKKEWDPEGKMRFYAPIS